MPEEGGAPTGGGVKGFLTKKVGPMPVWLWALAGGAVIAGVVYLNSKGGLPGFGTPAATTGGNIPTGNIGGGSGAGVDGLPGVAGIPGAVGVPGAQGLPGVAGAPGPAGAAAGGGTGGNGGGGGGPQGQPPGSNPFPWMPGPRRLPPVIVPPGPGNPGGLNLGFTPNPHTNPGIQFQPVDPTTGLMPLPSGLAPGSHFAGQNPGDPGGLGTPIIGPGGYDPLAASSQESIAAATARLAHPEAQMNPTSSVPTSQMNVVPPAVGAHFLPNGTFVP